MAKARPTSAKVRRARVNLQALGKKLMARKNRLAARR